MVLVIVKLCSIIAISMRKNKHLQIKALVFLLIFCTGCSQAKSVDQQMLLMGSRARISIISDGDLSQHEARETLSNAFGVLKNYDQKYSFYDAKSEISKINQKAAIGPVPVSKDSFQIVNKALDYSRITDGVFDITATSLQRIGGYDSIELQDTAGGYKVYFTDSNALIDLGGILAGIAVDEVVELFEKQRIKNYIIDIGGDIYAKGQNAKQRAWRIGIRNPFDEAKTLYEFGVDDQAVTTSGNYVKKHLIKLTENDNLQEQIESVTVVGPTCTDADVFATVFYLMGIEKTKAFLSKTRDDLSVIFVINKNEKPEIVKLNWNFD